MKQDIFNFLYIQAGITSLALVLVVTYFPNKPPTPPSNSAKVERVEYKKGVKKLLRNGQFWLIAACFGMAIGTKGGWTTTAVMNLRNLGLNQSTVAWILLAAGLAGNLGNAIGAPIGDLFPRRQKRLILMGMTLSTVTSVIFALACQNIIFPFSSTLAYVTLTLTMASLFATTPMFIERICETAFPVSEGVANGLMQWLINLACMLFLLVPASGSTMWMNWVSAAGTFVCIPAMVLHRENYSRAEIDSGDDVNVLNVN